MGNPGQELRNRLMWSTLFVLAGIAAGYLVHGLLLEVLQLRLSDKLQHTIPVGSTSLSIKASLVFGLIAALPAVVYHVFAFIGPHVKTRSKRIFAIYVSSSFVLACLGLLIAYYASLPTALKFLLNSGLARQFLMNANEYFNFVLAYYVWFPVLFQLPLILMFINKAQPVRAKKLLAAGIYAVPAGIVVAAFSSPRLNLLNTVLLAVSFITFYLLSVTIVSIVNRAKAHKRTEARDWMDIPETAFENMMHDLEQPVGQILQPAPQLEPIPVVDEVPPAIQEPVPPEDYVAQPPIDLGVRGRGTPSYQPRGIQLPPGNNS
jgi:sec-independent protein translocase protein TatC